MICNRHHAHQNVLPKTTSKAFHNTLNHLQHRSSSVFPLHPRADPIRHGGVHRARKHLVFRPVAHPQPVRNGAEQEDTPYVVVRDTVRRGLLPDVQHAEEHAVGANKVDALRVAARAEKRAFEVRVMPDCAEEVREEEGWAACETLLK